MSGFYSIACADNACKDYLADICEDIKKEGMDLK